MHRSDPANRKTAGPWAEIDLSALCENFEILRAAAPGAEAAAVVKCDAYGVGLAPVAKALADRAGCRSFFVAYPEEGAELRAALGAGDATIYVFNGPLPETMAIFDAARLTPVLNSIEQAEKWAARKPGAPCALHVDTGMNRLGAPLADVDAIAARDGLNVAVVMSHLACSADPADPKNNLQRAAFESAAAKFPGARRSLAASAGALMTAPFHVDMTRLGVALYGASPFEVDEPRLKPVVSLYAPIVQLRAIAPGESVGYGATFVATRPTRIAVAALGYGDGYPTSGANAGAAVIGAARAPIAGRVSMDLICLDITDVAEPVSIGARAEFFGSTLSLFEAARACGRIPYELLTGLGGRVDRRYV